MTELSGEMIKEDRTNDEMNGMDAPSAMWLTCDVYRAAEVDEGFAEGESTRLLMSCCALCGHRHALEL